jgi:hypothetical protein
MAMAGLLNFSMEEAIWTVTRHLIFIQVLQSPGQKHLQHMYSIHILCECLLFCICLNHICVYVYIYIHTHTPQYIPTSQEIGKSSLKCPSQHKNSSEQATKDHGQVTYSTELKYSTGLWMGLSCTGVRAGKAKEEENLFCDKLLLWETK